MTIYQLVNALIIITLAGAGVGVIAASYANWRHARLERKERILLGEEAAPVEYMADVLKYRRES